jgi:hypothetical protein
MSARLTEPTNEYQQTLYPKLKELCTRLSTKYVDTFLTTFDNDVERQVFGANLNGNRNNGSLYRSIPSGVNRNLTYNYAQFGQLVRVLTSRLRFIAQRDPSSVQRYKDTPTEFTAYQKLQASVNTFLTFVGELLTEWNLLVSETRTKFAPSQSDTQGQHTRQPNGKQREQRPRHTQESGQYGQRQYRQRQYRQKDTTVTSQNTNGTGTETSTGSDFRPQYRPVRRQQSTQNSSGSGTSFGEWVTPRTSVRTRNVRQPTKASVTLQ